MTFARKLFATSMIAAACAIPGALLCSATASADPVATPGAPSVPGLPFLSSFNPANAPALIQTMASALTGAPAAAPAAPAPAATASVTLPQAPAVPAAPAASALTAPALTAPAAAAAAPSNGLIPSADVKLPQIPGSPLPLPQQVNFPGDLASLAPAGTPLAGLFPKPATAVPAVATPLTATAPLATAPLTAAAASPVSGFDQLAPLMVPPAALSALP